MVLKSLSQNFPTRIGHCLD